MKKVMIVLFLVLIVPAFLSAGGQSEGVAAPSVIGVVEYLDGEVTVNDQPADFGMKVPYGAVVTTGPDSYCEIVFDRKNIFRIQELTVAEINISPSNPEIVIRQGTFAALFNKLGAFTSDEPFKVRTQTAVAGVRGTAFFVKAVDENTTYICICNGELDVSAADTADSGDVRKISSGHHKAFYLSNSDGKNTFKQAPLLYHDDDDMDALARHIDENVDWYY